ncbi:hypothetical protein [Mangrovicoccus ximenensis]|nr:hypothetical protein [Mangrovicoccus ximenensis]
MFAAFRSFRCRVEVSSQAMFASTSGGTVPPAESVASACIAVVK